MEYEDKLFRVCSRTARMVQQGKRIAARTELQGLRTLQRDKKMGIELRFSACNKSPRVL